MIGWHIQFVGAFESPWSIAQKLAWLNACEVPQILSTLVGQNIHPSHKFNSRNFIDMEWWRSSLTTSIGSTDLIDAAAALLGDQRSQRFQLVAMPLLATNLRLCEECIRMGYHSIVHQLAGLALCPIHGTPMRNVCPQCHRLLGPYVVVRHRGFRCRGCDVPFLPDDELPAPSECTLAAQVRAMSPIVAWIEQVAPQLHIPWGQDFMLGRSGHGRVEAVSVSEALLPLLSLIKPCPLAPEYLVQPVSQLRISVHSPSDAVSKLKHASITYVSARNVVAKTRAWLCDKVVREHYLCYERGRPYLQASDGFLAYRPGFCVRAYAYALWHNRTNTLLSDIEKASHHPTEYIAINSISLRDHLVSSYNAALNSLELLFAMYNQKNESAFYKILENGCLAIWEDPWIRLEYVDEHARRLVPCTVAFTRPCRKNEQHCDHGAVADGYFEKQRLALEAADIHTRNTSRRYRR